MNKVFDHGSVFEKITAKKFLGAEERMYHHTFWTLRKFHADIPLDRLDDASPYETLEIDGNILVNTGINAVLTLTCGGTATAFNAANSYLGVGDSTTVEAVTQTDLQAATNKLRQITDSGYPTYGTNQQMVFQATFAPANANWVWNEFAVFNALTAGIMMNRKVQALGTKTSSDTFQLVCTTKLS